MNEIEMTAEQIINLIFERKVKIGETEVLSKNSFHEILGKLEQRLCYGKIDRSQDTAFCGDNDTANTRVRIKPIGRAVNTRRPKMYDSV